MYENQLFPAIPKDSKRKELFDKFFPNHFPFLDASLGIQDDTDFFICFENKKERKFYLLNKAKEEVSELLKEDVFVYLSEDDKKEQQIFMNDYNKVCQHLRAKKADINDLISLFKKCKHKLHWHMRMNLIVKITELSIA